MLSQRRLLLCLCALTATLVSTHDVGRELLQTKKKEKERAREEDALEDYYIQQATLNKEQERVLAFATEEAVPIAKKIDKSGKKKQVKLLADLWENAKGVTIVKTLSLLIDLTPKKRIYYFEVNSDAMDMAEDNGYGFKVSEAVYNSLAVTDPNNDHYHLLDALLFRMEQKDKKSKGSGCQYIEFLFTDAEAWAIDDGRAQQFFRGFDNKDYLPLTECFLAECKGVAAKCCSDKKSVSSGLCGCKTVDKKKKSLQCAHNLFWTAPRVIWLCGTQDCDPDEKCICADPKAKKKGKDAKSDSGKGKGKEKDEDEKKKGKKSDKSSKETKGKDTKGKDTKDKETKGKNTKGKETKGKNTKGKETKGKDTKGKETKGKSEKEVKKTSKSQTESKTVKKPSEKSKTVKKSSEKSKTVEKTKKGESKTKSEKAPKTSSKSVSKKSSKESRSKKSVKEPVKVPKTKSTKLGFKETTSKKTKKTKFVSTRRET